MKLPTHKLIWTLIFFGWLVLIAVFTSIPFSEGIKTQNEGGFRYDYLEHFVFYALIPVFFNFARGAYLVGSVKNLWWLFAGGILFCILTEVQQIIVPGRSFNPVDLGLNLLGFVSGTGFVRFVLGIHRFNHGK